MRPTLASAAQTRFKSRYHELVDKTRPGVKEVTPAEVRCHRRHTQARTPGALGAVTAGAAATGAERADKQAFFPRSPQRLCLDALTL